MHACVYGLCAFTLATLINIEVHATLIAFQDSLIYLVLQELICETTENTKGKEKKNHNILMVICFNLIVNLI
jgi:hypothetical protein